VSPATDLSACVNFLQRLIRIESLPGEEGAAAALVRDEMTALGYDEVAVDEAGNVIGTVRGRGAAPAVMFNTHLDHVGVGDPARWPSPPFDAQLRDQRIWGRGAVDIKGPLAAQVYALGSLVAEGQRPAGDVRVTAVVQEEIGGVGARFLASRLTAPVVVIGEPSGNHLRRGHRGRLEILVRVHGKSVHASVPERGRNPLHPLARFITHLESLEMRRDPELGSSSMAPTRFWTDQITTNVIPAEVSLMCDWRSVPGESGGEICERLQQIADACCIEGTRAEVSLAQIDARTYSGHTASFPAHHPAFLTDAAHPAVLGAERALRDAIGLDERAGVYRFATDGGLFAPQAQAVIGFGPGDGALAHTVDECIEVSALETGIRGYRALALVDLLGATP
jgi:putative selenium metabolism hydrolase